MKLVITFVLGVMCTAYAQNAPIIDLEVFATGFDKPIDIQNAGDDRLFIAQQSGLIRILNADGTINPTPFMDLTNIINDSGFEEGLLGLAIHPDYTTNGLFFLNYTETIAGNDFSTIARAQVSASDPNVADPNSLTPLITTSQPFSNHNGGCLQFGPDGYLYISWGDGGSGGDPGNRSQSLTTLLGKILRIDVDNTDTGLNYGIPADNPFVDDPNALNEIWAYGIRNAWKFSFDSATDDLWIADVGQNAIEEINRVSAASTGGENYGWRCYEGDAPFNTSGCPDPSTLVFPVAQYTHTGNGLSKCSITGGYVYRGTLYPNMVGSYVFADWCSTEMATLSEDNVMEFFGPFGGGITSLGQDVNNELYASASTNGTVYRVVDTSTLSLNDSALSETKLFPNPAQDIVRLEYPAFAKAKQLNIYDLSGKLVQTQTIASTETTFSISALASGMYIAQLAGTNQSIKLVKQ